jgi:hypothetical protein
MNFYKKWISVFMAFLYIVVGAILISTDWFVNGNNKWMNIALGALICFYGLFRGFRSYQAFKDDKNE